MKQFNFSSNIRASCSSNGWPRCSWSCMWRHSHYSSNSLWTYVLIWFWCSWSVWIRKEVSFFFQNLFISLTHYSIHTKTIFSGKKGVSTPTCVCFILWWWSFGILFRILIDLFGSSYWRFFRLFRLLLFFFHWSQWITTVFIESLSFVSKESVRFCHSHLKKVINSTKLNWDLQ